MNILIKFIYSTVYFTSDKVAKEDNTVVNKTSDDRTPDPFDVAAAAPAPSAPNFPFVNKADLPVPTISSWGFQRVTIDTKNSSSKLENIDTLESKPSTPTDSFHISENSDDFVFASKHSKPREDKKIPKCDIKNDGDDKNLGDFNTINTTCTPDNTADNSTLVEKDLSAETTPKIHNSNHIDLDVSKEDVVLKPPFVPSLGTSTPLVASDKNVNILVNGVSCQQKLFSGSCIPTEKHADKGSMKCNSTADKETNSVTSIVNPIDVNRTPEHHVDDLINDFDSDASGFDDLTSKENVERLIKPISPLTKPKSPVISSLSKSPPNKRRKLDSPPSTPPLDRTLLKNRPDLIKEDDFKKSKQDCKLVSNQNPLNKTSQYKPTIKKPKKDKSVSLNEVSKSKVNVVENNHSRPHKLPRKLKKKDVPQQIDLFSDGPIRLPELKNEKPKIVPDLTEVLDAKKNSIPPSSSENCHPKIEPLTLSVPKKDNDNHKDTSLNSNNAKSTKTSKSDALKENDAKSELKKSEIVSQPSTCETPDEQLSTSIKISLKSVKNSKYKSKSTVDTEDDLSSLSSDSLEGFRDLLPKKVAKVKKSSEHKSNKRTFKTKAELKNPWPSSIPSPNHGTADEILQPCVPLKEVEKKKKTGGVTTKIKIGKPSISVSPKSNLAIPKTTVKLKLPNTVVTDSQEVNSSVCSVYSQPSLMIDESFDSTKPEEEPIVVPTLKIPKIKIKIGGSHVANDCPSSPNLSFSSSILASPDQPALKAVNPPSNHVPSKSIPPLKLSTPKPKSSVTPKGSKTTKNPHQETHSTPKLVLPAKANQPYKSDQFQTKENPTLSKGVSSVPKNEKIPKASLPVPQSIPALKIKIPDQGHIPTQHKISTPQTKLPVVQKEKKDKKPKKIKAEKKSVKTTEKSSVKVRINSHFIFQIS